MRESSLFSAFQLFDPFRSKTAGRSMVPRPAEAAFATGEDWVNSRRRRD